jgi:hypothetical protein
LHRIASYEWISMNESGDKSESKRACSIWVDNQRIVSIGHERKALEKLLWGFGIQYLESESGAQLELCEIPSLVTLWQ